MSTLNLSFTLQAGTPENVGHVESNFQDVRSWANGNIDGVNMTTGAKEFLALNDGTTVRRGKTIIASAENTTSTTYTTLTTPDQVSNVVLPTDGLIYIWYTALWFDTVASAARAAIFIGANQLRAYSVGGGGPIPQETVLDTANRTALFNTGTHGLDSGDTPIANLAAPVTTGQILGGTRTLDVRSGACVVYAAAGTYDISVQFKTSSGTLTASNRKLWVEAKGF